MIRYGIVLAAGDGLRLRPFVQRWRGDALPKQYVSFTGSCSMLEQTFRRVERLIEPERLLTVVGLPHLSFSEAARQLAPRPPGTVVVQPRNQDTGPGILLPLAHVTARDPNAVVAVFPSDHFIGNEALFMGYVDLACRAVEREPDRLVLLGVEPAGPEPDYGYILPGRRATDGIGLKRVARFIEKPHPAEARELLGQGALWNTFVMVAQPRALWDLVRRVAPALWAAFNRIRRAIGETDEQIVVDEVYRTLSPVNFSKDILERVQADDSLTISVVPVRGVSWNDWGSERRLVADLQSIEFPKGMDRFRPDRFPVESAGSSAEAV